MISCVRNLSVLVFLMGCGDGALGDQDILSIGDSLLDFHAPDADIATVAGSALGLDVEHGAVGGTTMLGGDSIPDSYVDGSFSLLIASGGGNDFGECGCDGGCDEVLDDLLSEDGTEGAIAVLVDRAVGDGKSVIWVGYLRPMDDAEEFSDCDAELDVYRERLSALDAREAAMVFVDGATIGTGSEDELYEPDGYHPSEAGSLALGEAAANQASAAFGL